MTPEQQKALALARARRRRAEAQGKQSPPNEWSAQQEADKIEAIQKPGAISDASASVVAKGIPFADEIVGGMMTPVRAAKDWWNGDGLDLGRSYDRSVELERELQRRREDRSPIASTVGSIAGGMALGGVAASGGATLLQGAKPTLASLAGGGAAEGAAYGALYGAGEGDGLDDRVDKAVRGGIVGGVTGGALGALGRIGAGKVDPKAYPSADDLHATASAAYKAADDAGVVYTPEAMDRLFTNLRSQFADFGYDPALQPKAAVALGKIEELVGQNVTLKGLDTVRKIAGNAYEAGNKSSNALSTKIASAIDDLVTNPQAGDVLTGDGAVAANAIESAREAYRQARKLEIVQALLGRGEANAATSGTGANVENATRQQLKRFLLNEKMNRGFTDPEMSALSDAVLGTKLQNALRAIGKMSPDNGGLMGALHLLGAGSTGGASLPFAAATTVAKHGADAMSRNPARIVEALIANGGQALPPPTVSAARKAIIDALVRGGGQVAPRYTGQ